jgi:ferric-dicitrate binding protein FerR (iron transport regulator)
MADVRASVEAEWRATLATRQRRRHFSVWATAAGVAVAAVAVWVARPLVQPGHETAASFARVVGDVQQNTGNGRWTPVVAADSIEAGTQLRTGTGGRAAIRLRDGLELRLDSRTLLALEDAQHAALSKGAVYVDSGATTGAPGPEFALETPAGTVRHLGTQYEARVVDGSLRVAVREGRVQIGSPGGDVLGDAGEQLTLSDGQVVRSRVAPTAKDWDWVATITPPFSIEGRSVDAFLAWAGRETGRAVVYVSPETARQARGVVLSGTVDGLTPDEAVVAVLSTTSLRPVVEAEHIRIDASAP